MRASIIKPASVIEVVRRVFVMAHVAAVSAVAGPTVAATVGWPNATDDHESTSIRRPAKRADAVLEIRNASGFAAIHRQQVNLSARLLGRHRCRRRGRR